MDPQAESFGRRLVREGRISENRLSEAACREVSAGDLCGLALSGGWIPEDELQESWRAWLTGTLQEPFGWAAGEYRFSEEQVARAPFEPDVLHATEAYLAAIDSMAGFAETIRDALLAVGRPLQLRQSAAIPLGSLNLSPAQGFLLSRIDGTLSLGEVLSLLPPDSEEGACRFVYSLLLLGVANFEPPLAPGLFATSSLIRQGSEEHERDQSEAEFIRPATKRARRPRPTTCWVCPKPPAGRRSSRPTRSASRNSPPRDSRTPCGAATVRRSGSSKAASSRRSSPFRRPRCRVARLPGKATRRCRARRRTSGPWPCGGS